MKGKHVFYRTYLNIINQRNPRGQNNNSNNNPERNRIQNFTLFSFSGLYAGLRRSNDNTNINIEEEVKKIDDKYQKEIDKIKEDNALREEQCQRDIKKLKEENPRHQQDIQKLKGENQELKQNGEKNKKEIDRENKAEDQGRNKKYER